SGNAPLDMRFHFNPGKSVFNDTVWNITPSDIRFCDRRLTVDRFNVSRPGQQISINGIASESADDSVHVHLDDINLDYVFETLGIANAMFGGRATGNFYAAAALSPSPRLYTDDLHVAGIKYNYCRMGDADIRSRWDVDEKAVRIYADIAGEHGNISTIDGMIKPLTEELDFRFHADDVPVGFLKPFMEAFTSDVKGHASGDAHLYGTFKLLDMTGDLFARDFTLKLDFTNCYYSTTDSIHLRPGRIDIPSVRLRDPMGHTALLNGLVTHHCFKEPTFDFAVTEAKSLLVYDIAPTAETIWYGKVFGNGGAHVKGVPGRIDIGVDMATAPGSSFSFVLSDSEEASDYDFITFRDITPVDPDLANRPPTTLDIIADLRKRVAAHSDVQSSPSIYNMEFDIDVNPNTLVTLVMDPVGGDRIRARGSGNMRLAYNSADDDLKLYGRYTLTEGSYNFTLQDIIIKEFTIDDGSEISFTGNPYAPQLDVKAIYSLNANLSDLDESFLQ
ncbi:MAG: translocation/assembly module TamB, partial [Paramuribaculum sp.]|nr:translocation/assembly module TamB [Paramuribaculum sp.]